jgi:hypothetical protein
MANNIYSCSKISNPTLPPHAEILQIEQDKTLKMRVAQLNVQKQDVQAAENC